MIYLMKVRVKYKKGKSWFISVVEIVSHRDEPKELERYKPTSNTLKEAVIDRKSKAFTDRDNFLVLEILTKHPISRSFYYMESV